MSRTFLEFFKRDETISKQHLKLLKKVFEEDGMYTQDFFDDEEVEPYIFVMAPSDLSFQGVRFYQKGNILAYRVQKAPKTVPYGKPYEMDLQKMIDDILLSEKDKMKATEKLAAQICKKVKDFFKQTKKAEERILDSELSDNGLDGSGKITIRNANNEPTNPKAANQNPMIVKLGGTDYSSNLTNSNTSN